MIPRRTLADRADVLGVAMLAPALAYVILLVGVPFVLAILLSFSNATAGSLSSQSMRFDPATHRLSHLKSCWKLLRRRFWFVRRLPRDRRFA